MTFDHFDLKTTDDGFGICRMIVRKLVHLINKKGNFFLEEFLVPAAVNYLRKEMEVLNGIVSWLD